MTEHIYNHIVEIMPPKLRLAVLEKVWMTIGIKAIAEKDKPFEITYNDAILKYKEIHKI